MTNSVLGRVNAVLYRAIKEILIFTGLALIALTFAGVITRYVLKINLDWAYEISILMLVWTAFLGGAAAARTKGHILFDMFLNKLPGKGRYAVIIIKDVLILAFIVLGVYFGCKVVLRTLSQNFQTIDVPVGFLYAALPGGFIPMFLFNLELLLEYLKAGPGGAGKEGV
jgi:TRAP-type C4-dicarboxylate transport system permease small subunit